MAYCYQCKGCITDLDCPPEDNESWCKKKLISVAYKDPGCDRFEWNKELKKSNSNDNPSFEFNEKYSRYLNQYFRYKEEPEVIYQLIKCFDSFMIYKVIRPDKVLPLIKYQVKEYVIPEGFKLEVSDDGEEWEEFQDL